MSRFTLRLCLCALTILTSQNPTGAAAAARTNKSAHPPNSLPGDEAILAALDEQYQAAVKHNDDKTMDQILADNFVLVTGSGKTYTKKDLLEEARSGLYIYEHQEDSERSVRMWGDTAVVTAKLWEKGSNGGRPFDYTVWFSDLYIRASKGWRYVFGQSSLPLPTSSIIRSPAYGNRKIGPGNWSRAHGESERPNEQP
jgi:ketosteroid isomerase-like protein